MKRRKNARVLIPLHHCPQCAASHCEITAPVHCFAGFRLLKPKADRLKPFNFREF